MNFLKSAVSIVMLLAFTIASATIANADFQVFFDDFEDEALGVFAAPGNGPVVGDSWSDGWANGSDVVVDSPTLNGNRSLEMTRNHPSHGSDPILFPAHDAISVWGVGAFGGGGTTATFIWNTYRKDATSGSEIQIKPGAAIMGSYFVNSNDAYAQGSNRIFATNAGTVTSTGVDSIPGEWETMKLVASFVQVGPNMGGTYDLFLSNSLGANQLIADDFALTSVSLAAIVDDTLRFRLNHQGRNAVDPLNIVYYDDLEILSSVPEPTTLSLIGFGLVGLLRRRKQS